MVPQINTNNNPTTTPPPGGGRSANHNTSSSNHHQQQQQGNQNNNQTINNYEHSWEPEISKLIQLSMQERYDNSNYSSSTTIKKRSKQPFMVALIGIPGGGKSISSLLLANFLEQQQHQQGEEESIDNSYDSSNYSSFSSMDSDGGSVASTKGSDSAAGTACDSSHSSSDSGSGVMIMPHDGYHYSMEQLRQMPNAEDLIYRRGAPDTFDPIALQRDLERIRYGDEPTIALPAFDHARGDPQPNTHIFDRHSHDVVICEGLYLLHDRDGWEDIASCFDLTIFINSDLGLCMERVKIRNQCIPGFKNSQEVADRTEKVDRLNALKVLESQSRADVIVESLTMQKQKNSTNTQQIVSYQNHHHNENKRASGRRTSYNGHNFEHFDARVDIGAVSSSGFQKQ